MLILWILFGVVIGMILAYLWLGKQHRKAMADLEGSWYEKVRRAEDAAAKAMAEAEAIKAGDDPKTVSLRRVDEPATEVASGAASGVAPGAASESSVVAAQDARPGNGSAAANGGAVAAFTGEPVAEDEDLEMFHLNQEAEAAVAKAKAEAEARARHAAKRAAEEVSAAE